MSRYTYRRSESPPSQSQSRLPAYEPPILPLHPRAIPQLTQDFLENTKKDSELLRRARVLLASSASDLGQRSLFAVGEEKDSMVQLLEGLDSSAKRLVDYRRSVTDCKDVIVQIVEEEEIRAREVTPPPAGELTVVRVEEGVWGRFSDGVKARRERWEALSEFEKYANHKDYELFRRTYWDARNPDIPPQSAREWFRVGAADDEDEDEDEDDLQIARQTESYKCPLTQREFTDPVRAPKCGHTFEKDAIIQLLGNHANMTCPANGCSQNFARRDLEPNKFIMMKLARHRATEERRKRERDIARDNRGADEEEEEEEEDEQPTRSKVKNERGGARRKKSRRETVVSVDDDDE
ncbi:zinc-finger of the MIZ type in Nse subunit-domain-containing protein [Tricharina praecox]|uniref:zinc-finger of the MIZ type in Nse subunit-domain-containing protein n=1 Tax=Tricharina praecox TaxID=43433 RepID=UPI00222086C4|nr:zinc-finger of the MIZ type in Nse subunit-domain-containing protein [Tricharina praecox]KAI5845375.1 zinc-finger of the MIZ type in Nse subunit-domain-containing protein [Tricharina praecox]